MLIAKFKHVIHYICRSLILEVPLGNSYGKKINYIKTNNKYYENSKSSNNVFLKHFRLEILDLDSKATQPMISNDNQHALLFNGEIYNHQELRNF